ncbi:MAG: tetratricopeptide repeat protein [Candidatus Pacearchaeota archaeon]|jgi:tetratricopeptide (TPR) repeat protein
MDKPSTISIEEFQIYKLYSAINEIKSNSDPIAMKTLEESVIQDLPNRRTTKSHVNNFEYYLESMTKEDREIFFNDYDSLESRVAINKIMNETIDPDPKMIIANLRVTNKIYGEVRASMHSYFVTIFGEGFLEKAVERDVNNDYTQAEKANSNASSFFQEGKIQEAIKGYNTSIELSPSYANPYINLSILFRKAGDLEKSIEFSTKATELAPTNKIAWYQKAAGLSNIGNIREAKECLEKALYFDPEYESALSLRGQIKVYEHNN